MESSAYYFELLRFAQLSEMDSVPAYANSEIWVFIGMVDRIQQRLAI